MASNWAAVRTPKLSHGWRGAITRETLPLPSFAPIDRLSEQSLNFAFRVREQQGRPFSSEAVEFFDKPWTDIDDLGLFLSFFLVIIVAKVSPALS